MAGFIRDAAQSLADSEWHILEIRDKSAADDGPATSSSGELILWVMLTNGSLQRLTITMPRTLYVSCKEEVGEMTSPSLTIKRVEKYLPHNKTAKHLYEVTMPEHTYRSNSWLEYFRSSTKDSAIESFYELSTSQMLRSLLRVGCVCGINHSAVRNSGKYALSDLKLVDQPAGGQYLNRNLSYRKIFLYERLHTRSKTGLIAVFVIDSSSSDLSHDDGVDITCRCHVWAVQPGGKKAQRNISKKICESIFSELIQQVHHETADDAESSYAALSPASLCGVDALTFVDTEDKAFKGVNDTLNTYSQANNGPTLLLLNSTKSVPQLRKRVPSCNSYPLIVLPSPPGPAHNASTTSLPSLNWEKESVQLCFEAYIYMGAVSLQKQIEHARYAKVPLGNLGTDALITTYDVMFARVLQKNRALLWASSKAGRPDVGLNSISLVPGSSITGLVNGQSNDLDSNDIWGDEDENISPVVFYPGAYRSICAEIDIHNLAIAALSDSRASLAGSTGKLGAADANLANGNAPLGDEMSTATSLPLLRSLVQSWLRDASALGIPLADQLLSHLYRLVSSPSASFNDPALHRVVVSLMKATFHQLLGEFQRLGSTIISATFNRVVIATNKTNLPEAMEYVDFVIATIKKRMASSEESADFGRLSLQRNNFYAHYIFLDEHNHGGLLFENREPEDDEEAQWAFDVEMPTEEGQAESITVVPTAESGWNIKHYLASEMAQEYFRAVISRFSKDVYRKQVRIEQKALELEANENAPQPDDEEGGEKEDSRLPPREQLHLFKKKLISKHFAAYLTQAVGEIIKDGGGPESFPTLPGSHLALSSPVLEFIKNVIVVLELDPDVDTEVQHLKKSLLAQIGVQEYSNQAKWQNPCARFVLPDVFCSDCQECRDVDLCILPPPDQDQDSWTCDDCGTPYDAESIERRLIEVIQRKCVRYQLQDLRCTKTGRVSTRVLSRQSDTSQKLELDISREEVASQLQILNNLAQHYNLEWLLETTTNLLQAL